MPEIIRHLSAIPVIVTDSDKASITKDIDTLCSLHHIDTPATKITG